MSASFSTLIGAHDLAERLHDPDWILFDCRFDLANPDFGRDAYDSGHIPGAFFLDLDDDLSGPKTGRNGRHPLPDPAALMSRLKACGVSNHTQVVAYDDANGMFAARLWWLMRWLGHHRVAVLDGGLQAWARDARVLTEGVPEDRAGTYTLCLQPCRVD
ncbi:MAG: sulfurtransferase, partial [Betaproteobacteria bacterium HGW-Betaproteobacteria-21]